MRRHLLIALCLSSLVFTASGCKGDPNTPEYWAKAIAGGKGKNKKKQVVEDLRASKKVTPAFLPMLHAALAAEKSGEVKAALARLIGEQKSADSVGPLTDAIDFGATESDEKTMNKEIAMSLSDIGDKKAVPTLVKLLTTKDNYTVIAAIEGLGALKATEAFEPLEKLATGDGIEPFISKKAIQALGEIADPRAVPSLVRMMFKERKGVSFYAESSFALYQVGPKAGDALLPVIKNEDKELLKWAEESHLIPAALLAKSAQVLGDLHDMRAEKPVADGLKFSLPDPSIQGFVRIRMADAAGRMRSQVAGKQLQTMLEEEETAVRTEYARALAKIGAKDAVPALMKAAGKGGWDAREACMISAAMLGGEAELPAFAKLVDAEDALTRGECKDNEGYKGCDKPDDLVKAHKASIESHKARLEAAKECKDDLACWAKKLDDKNEGVRERAAMTLGRGNDAKYLGELTKRLTEKNLDTRLAIIQGLDWLVIDNKDAAKAALEAVPALDKQLADEKGKTEFVKVNEDLKRLAVLLKRAR